MELSDLVGPRRAAQALSARALGLGAEGMIVPSAALDGRWNLVVFPPAFAKLAVEGATTTRPKPPA